MSASRHLKQWLRRSPVVDRISSAMRARMQEHGADQARRRIESVAAAKEISALSVDDTTLKLRDRLKTRAQLRGWPRQKGTLHIFIAFRQYDWEVVLRSAFAPFGEVSIFEWSENGFDNDAADWAQQKSTMNNAMLTAFHAANSRRPVDVVIGYLSGQNTMPSTLAEMSSAGAAIFNFSYDDKLDLDAQRSDGIQNGPVALARVVDLNLTSDPGANLKYGIHGGLAHFHPEAAHPCIHRPYDVPFEFDVTFIGACYGFRPQFIRHLRHLGIDVKAFGRGWPAGTVPLDKMVEIYSRSRINLGFGGIGHSRRLMCLKGRDFEVPMAGGLYVTQHNSDLELVFDVGNEIITYQDEIDCARKIKALLLNPSHASGIRAAARNRCLRDHTYEARWAAVFRMAGILEA